MIAEGSHSNNGAMIRYLKCTASRTIYTHGYRLTSIETAKISFELQTKASNFYTTNHQPFGSA